jgi:hypothetical protein
MKLDKDETISHLSGCCEVTIGIECSKCKKPEGSWVDNTMDFSEDLYKKGWRIDTKGYAICPKCSKGKKK